MLPAGSELRGGAYGCTSSPSGPRCDVFITCRPYPGPGFLAKHGRYLLLLALQTTGVILFHWHGLPLYRQLSADPASCGVTGDPPALVHLRHGLTLAGLFSLFLYMQELQDLGTAFLRRKG